MDIYLRHGFRFAFISWQQLSSDGISRRDQKYILFIFWQEVALKALLKLCLGDVILTCCLLQKLLQLVKFWSIESVTQYPRFGGVCESFVPVIDPTLSAGFSGRDLLQQGKLWYISLYRIGHLAGIFQERLTVVTLHLGLEVYLKAAAKSWTPRFLSYLLPMKLQQGLVCLLLVNTHFSMHQKSLPFLCLE